MSKMRGVGVIYKGVHLSQPPPLSKEKDYADQAGSCTERPMDLPLYGSVPPLCGRKMGDSGHRKGKKGRKPPIVERSCSEEWFEEIGLEDV